MKKIAHLFKSLGDETRLRIMALLIGDLELCVCDIMAALELPQSTVSRHLSSLRNAGFVDDRRQGIWMYYKLNKKGIEHGAILFDFLEAIFVTHGQTTRDHDLLKVHLAIKKRPQCS